MLKVIRSRLHNLFIPLLFWLLGIIIATKITYVWPLNLIITAAFIIFIFVPKLRTYLLLFLFLGLSWMYTSSFLKHTHNDVKYYLTPEKTIQEVFEYKLLQKKLTSKGKHYYLVELKKVNQYSLKGKVLLYNAPDSLKINHIYQTPLAISTINKAHNPGEFDFNKFYTYAGIQAWASALGITQNIGQDDDFWQDLKIAVITKIEKTFGDNKAMALALFIGEKGLLRINQEDLSEMGLLHLFAVSGLHVGIIYLTLLTMLNLLFNINRARFVASITLIFYGFLCSWSPSVFRTILIIMIYNLSLILQRKISFLQLLSLTLFIITISNPLQLFSVGLQLSLTAFISLWIADKCFLPYLYKLKKKYSLNKYLFSLGQYLIYTLSVIVFIAPLSAYYFNIISLNAIFTNVLAGPIVTLMLNIILFSLLFPQGFILQRYLAGAFNFMNYLFEEIINYASYLPLFTRKIALTPSEFLFIILVIVITFLLFRKRRVWALSFAAISILLLSFKIAGFFVIYQNQIICFDAGNADCTYLEFADKRKLLIDTGSQEQYPKIVKTSLLPYLKKRHIHFLDCVVITHPHEDHYGGLSLLANNIKIKELIIHKSALKDDAFANLIKDLDTEINITVLQDTASLWSGRIRFLHPDSSYESSNMNNNSLVAMVNYDDYKLLFTGDIEAEAEMRLIEQQGNKLKADFLKIAHHGSITGSQVEFLNIVNPHNCFIPAGSRDKEHFPNKVVIKRLNEQGTRIHNGNLKGALHLKVKTK